MGWKDAPITADAAAPSAAPAGPIVSGAKWQQAPINSASPAAPATGADIPSMTVRPEQSAVPAPIKGEEKPISPTIPESIGEGLIAPGVKGQQRSRNI